MGEEAFTRRQLYELVWTEPVRTLAPKFGLTDRGLGKLCERYAIPTPARGYWAKKQAGHKVTKAPLIEVEGSRLRKDYPVAKFAKARAPAAETRPDPLLAFWQEQRDDIGAVRVPKALTHPHPVIAGWLKDAERERAQRERWSIAYAPQPKATRLERRRLRILSALYKTLEARGVRIERPRDALYAELRHEQDKVMFDLKEYIQQKRRTLTDEERLTHWNKDATYAREDIATGLLRGKVDSNLPKGIPTQWTESEEKPFESFVGEIAATVMAALAYEKERRERFEEAERQHWKAQRERWKREEAEKAEHQRKEALMARVRDWRAAQDLRAYVEIMGRAAAGNTETASKFERWAAWALEYADSLAGTVPWHESDASDACDDLSLDEAAY